MALQLQEMNQKIGRIKENIGKVMIGKTSVIDLVLTSLIAGGHVLLEDVPGTGKTVLAKSLAKSVDSAFSRIQFTPDLLPTDITGLNYFNQKEGEFVFREGPVFCHILLADEINRATPRTQSSLLECMEEKQVTIDGVTHVLERPFFVIATQNPVETAGTYPLPEAQLDRFLFKLLVRFPAEAELKQIMAVTVGGKAPNLQCCMDGAELLEAREIIRELPMSESVEDYALHLVVSTHPELEGAPEIVRQYLTCGASPRAAQAMILTAKGRAFLSGRMNVAYEDVNAVAYPALRHRLLLNYEAISEGLQADDIICQLLTQ